MSCIGCDQLEQCWYMMQVRNSPTEGLLKQLLVKRCCRVAAVEPSQGELWEVTWLATSLPVSLADGMSPHTLLQTNTPMKSNIVCKSASSCTCQVDVICLEWPRGWSGSHLAVTEQLLLNMRWQASSALQGSSISSSRSCCSQDVGVLLQVGSL